MRGRERPAAGQGARTAGGTEGTTAHAEWQAAETDVHACFRHAGRRRRSRSASPAQHGRHDHQRELLHLRARGLDLL